MAKKIIKYDVAIKSTKQTWQMDVPKVYTNDLNSVVFQFVVSDLTTEELSTATATTLIYMKDGSFFQNPSTDVSKVGTTFSYTLKDNEGNHDGIAQIQLVVTIPTVAPELPTVYASQLYEFEVVSGLEMKVAQEIMIYDWTTLTAEAQVYLDQMAEKHAIADADHTRAANDHTTAVNDHTTAASDHTTALADHAVTADMILDGTNLIANGDFSNGTTGWSASDATISVADNTLSVTPTVQYGGVKSYNFRMVANNKYYVRMIINRANGVVINIEKNYTFYASLLPLPTAGSLVDTKFIYTPTETNDLYRLVIVSDMESGWTASLLKHVEVIDLTAAFGKGNEPTAEQMDRLLTQFPNSWFDGTENLFLAKWALNELRRLDNEKANKVQEAWITPTLLNGWVPTLNMEVAYMKDEFGFVHIRGRVTGGAMTSIIFSLPSGYRPIKEAAFPQIMSGNTAYRLNIFDTGDLRPYGTLNGELSLEGITFKAKV